MKYTKAAVKKIADTLPDMFAEGQSIIEVCAELKMSTETFYTLRHATDDKEQLIHPEFAMAVEKGLALSQAWWERLGRQGASAVVEIQPVTWIFNMKNRFNWKDRQELTGADDTPLFGGFVDAVKSNIPKKK